MKQTEKFILSNIRVWKQLKYNIYTSKQLVTKIINHINLTNVANIREKQPTLR